MIISVIIRETKFFSLFIQTHHRNPLKPTMERWDHQKFPNRDHGVRWYHRGTLVNCGAKKQQHKHTDVYLSDDHFKLNRIKSN